MRAKKNFFMIWSPLFIAIFCESKAGEFWDDLYDFHQKKRVEKFSLLS